MKENHKEHRNIFILSSLYFFLATMVSFIERGEHGKCPQENSSQIIVCVVLVYER